MHNCILSNNFYYLRELSILILMITDTHIEELGKYTSLNELFLFCDEISDVYRKETTEKHRKKYAQYFTPPNIAEFMGQLGDFVQDEIKILEPGAGFGILSISLLNHLIHQRYVKRIELSLYEKDDSLHEPLHLIFSTAKRVINNTGIEFEYYINSDFLLADIEENSFDCVISNPPYFKLGKKDDYSILFKEYVHGQPNIYTFFMILASKIIKSEGFMIFITPRSFCSGKYFQKFRRWFLDQISIDRIHSFISRKDNFGKDHVLQENIIIKYSKKDQNLNISISCSNGGDMEEISYIDVDSELVIHDSNKKIIRVPISEIDINLLKTLDGWKRTFSDTKYKVSTGPIVDFRKKEYLIEKYDEDNENSVQLFWLNSIRNYEVVHPVNNGKPQAILDNEQTSKILRLRGNYVLIKRFTSKEQKKRVQAGILLEARIKSKKIGMDNKLNYIYIKGEKLSIEETYGISYFLNHDIIDRYFRILNGSTQVNAYDVKLLPFPDENTISRLGAMLLEKEDLSDFQEYINNFIFASISNSN